jgi:hypothetical protein
MFRVQHRQILCGCAGLHHEMRGKTQVPGLAREPQPHDAVTGRVQTLQSNRRGRVHLKPVVDLAQGSAGAGPQADRLGSQPHRFAVGIGGRVVNLDSHGPVDVIGEVGGQSDASWSHKKTARAYLADRFHPPP